MSFWFPQRYLPHLVACFTIISFVISSQVINFPFSFYCRLFCVHMYFFFFHVLSPIILHLIFSSYHQFILGRLYFLLRVIPSLLLPRRLFFLLHPFSHHFSHHYYYSTFIFPLLLPFHILLQLFSCYSSSLVVYVHIYLAFLTNFHFNFIIQLPFWLCIVTSFIPAISLLFTFYLQSFHVHISCINTFYHFLFYFGILLLLGIVSSLLLLQHLVSYHFFSCPLPWQPFVPVSLILCRAFYLGLGFPFGVVFLLVLKSPLVKANFCAWVPNFLQGSLLASQVFPFGDCFPFSPQVAIHHGYIMCKYPLLCLGYFLRSQFPLGNIYFYSLSLFISYIYLFQGFYGCFRFLYLVAVFSRLGSFYFQS